MTKGADSSEPKRIGDPRELKALAHPLRMRLIVELTTQGSSRAADLAKVVDVPANSVSFHLHQLARYGLIVQDTERGSDRRERWWRVASNRGFQADLTELRKLPGGPQAVGSLVNLTQDVAHATLAAAFRDSEDEHEPSPWFNDFALHLSKNEIDQFQDELLDLVTRWMERSRQLASSGDDVERHTYVGFAFGAPLDEVLGATDK